MVFIFRKSICCFNYEEVNGECVGKYVFSMIQKWDWFFKNLRQDELNNNTHLDLSLLLEDGLSFWFLVLYY